MTEKELRRLSRAELLELLIDFGNQNEALNTQLAQATQKIKEQKAILENNISLAEQLEDARYEADVLMIKLTQAEKKLADKEIKLEQSGSIAEASLQLNGVFEAAQKAADQYLENLRMQHEKSEADREQVIEQAKQEAEKMLADTRAECDEMLQKAREEADSYYAEASDRIKVLVDAHEYLQAMPMILHKAKDDEAS